METILANCLGSAKTEDFYAAVWLPHIYSALPTAALSVQVTRFKRDLYLGSLVSDYRNDVLQLWYLYCPSSEVLATVTLCNHAPGRLYGQVGRWEHLGLGWGWTLHLCQWCFAVTCGAVNCSTSAVVLSWQEGRTRLVVGVGGGNLGNYCRSRRVSPFPAGIRALARRHRFSSYPEI